jgi:hypothetical protein
MCHHALIFDAPGRGFCSLCSGFTTMVDIRSIIVSSHPSSRGQENEQEATSYSRAVRSHQTNARNTATTMVATAADAHRQYSAAMAVITPPTAGPKGMLEVECVLLHNPPSQNASPSTVEQWRHDVDQLIIAAINMPLHGGRQANHSRGTLEPSPAHSCTPTVACNLLVARASTMSRTPIAVSLTTTDLRVELECRRSGEDDCTTIEHRWERRRNLDSDYGAVNAAPGAANAMHTPTSLRSGGGCMVLAPRF